MKNIFLLGTCRIRNNYCQLAKQYINCNLINYNEDFIGRTYSLIDTYEILNCIKNNKKNIYSHEFRNNQTKFKNNLNNINIENIDLFVIEISSIKYYTHSYKNMDSNILFSPNFGKNSSLARYNLNILTEKELDYYFNKIVELLNTKKILFVCHLKSNIIPNRILIKKNLIKNTKKYNNIFFITPEELLNTNDINKYLSDENHYNIEGSKTVSLSFLKLFKII